MKKSIAWTMAMVLGVVASRGVAEEAAEQKFEYKAKQMDAAAVVDGVAGATEYPAETMAMKQTPDRFPISGAPASARAFHDGKVLYVAVTVPIESADALALDEYWSQSDGAEVCFRAVSDDPEAPSFVIHGFANGKHESVMHGGVTHEEAEKLGKAVKFAAKATPTAWTAEWAIPLDAAGLAFKPGMKLDFNLGLWRSSTYEWINWRGTEGPTHKLSGAGVLILEGK
jgi:hypothetical protein